MFERDAPDFYRNARAEWIEARVRFAPAGLYVEELPPMLVAPWENKREVMRREFPDLSAHTVQDITSKTHVLAVAPDGSETFVPRDVPRLMAGATG